MTKIWTSLFGHILTPPETVAEAVEMLLGLLSVEEKFEIAVMPKDKLFDLHFGLGLAIRNAFRLHEPGSKLLASCGTSHPNDASSVIISALWRALPTWEP
ncbi:conserved protein of unknown function (plasmid) [Methylotuvimicrobium alcaliphilum 20Z]|uniref:DUF6794 domain-containing protein n=1 Tax=Methylotuvimicrobium alcaliphilum (strain DSM 19304 / NCIMB 14124 / VKM B-2133 / 20Z) TaxID=1091494 RepID=G4T4K5_META2|nr:conserved protein of unknown function [Methylotuvimicrobium alcaliphilum 20Z]